MVKEGRGSKMYSALLPCFGTYRCSSTVELQKLREPLAVTTSPQSPSHFHYLNGKEKAFSLFPFHAPLHMGMNKPSFFKELSPALSPVPSYWVGKLQQLLQYLLFLLVAGGIPSLTNKQ